MIQPWLVVVETNVSGTKLYRFSSFEIAASYVRGRLASIDDFAAGTGTTWPAETRFSVSITYDALKRDGEETA
jgi:hypothetical protein